MKKITLSTLIVSISCVNNVFHHFWEIKYSRSVTQVTLTFIFTLIAILGYDHAFCQSTFQKSFGGTGDDLNAYCISTTDGGFITVGRTNSFGVGGFDIIAVKTDKDLNIIWSRTFGGILDESLPDRTPLQRVKETSDKGCIIAGFTKSFGQGNSDAYLIRLDSTGTLLWSKTFGGVNEDFFSSVFEMPGGGFLMGGSSRTFSFGSRDFYLVRVDSNGDTLWTKNIGGSAHDNLIDMNRTADGGFILAGASQGFGSGINDGVLCKIDSLGNVEWIKAYGGSNVEGLFSVVQTIEGGYIASGRTGTFGVGDFDGWIVRTDSLGNLLWSKAYGGTGLEILDQVILVPNGGYAAVGETESFGAGQKDVFMVLIDSLGNLIESKAYGGGNSDFARSMELVNNGFLICGATQSFGTGGWDFYSIQTDILGNSGCNEVSITPSIVTVSPTVTIPVPSIGSGGIESTPPTQLTTPTLSDSVLCASLLDSITVFNCAIDSLLAQAIQDDSTIIQTIVDQEQITQDYIRDSIDTGGSHGPGFVIPVVVHIISNVAADPTTDIPDAQIDAQIVALNRAFNDLNGSTNPFGFNHDAEITFCLAQNLPDLSTNWNAFNPTGKAGVTRKDDPLVSSNHNPNLDQGELLSIGFPPERYLNIWVIHSMTGGVLGYSPKPIVPTSVLDGIVVLFNVFGDNTVCPPGPCNAMLAGYDEGTVTVHEAGHYLHLYHPFQRGLFNSDPTCQNNDCSVDGDFCCDTPPVWNDQGTPSPNDDGPNFDCILINTCFTDDDDLLAQNPYRPIANGGIGDQPDQVENYMDYTLDNCKDIFTNDQVNRMLEILLNNANPNNRIQLVSTENLVFTGVQCLGPYAALVADFNVENTQVCVGVSTAFTAVTNGNTATSYIWDFTGGIPSSANTAGPHAVTYNTPGIYDIMLTVDDGGGPVSTTQTIFVSNCVVTDLTQSDWFFGDRAALEFVNGQQANVPAPSPSAMFASEGCASVSDAGGNLLFYTNSQQVFDVNHNIMPGGPLEGSPNSSFFSASQGVVIVPDPGNINQYYIFTVSDGPVMGVTHGLGYSIVDMTIPPGQITTVNAHPGENYGTTEHIVAVPHCNNTDFWIIVHGTHNTPTTNGGPTTVVNDKILAFLVDAAGVANIPVESDAGPFVVANPFVGSNEWVGTIDVTVDGTRVAMTDLISSQCHIYDFDRESGEFTYLTSVAGNYGVCFSPNSDILYAKSGGNLVQYDLSSLTVCNTIIPSFAVTNQVDPFQTMQLGPDGKMYITRSKRPFLSVVNYPDILNTTPNACGFNLNAVTLICRQSRLGLPNMIDASPVALPADFEFCIDECSKVNFKNLGCGTNFLWDFDDGNTSTVQNPSHTYTALGNFDVSFTLDGGTPVTQTVTITSPTSLSLSSTDETVCGACDGTATVVSVINGTSPFVYLWDDPAAQTTQTAVGLCSGTFQVRVIDANDCIATANVNVGGPAPLLELMSTVDISCDGACDGFARVRVSGGTAPYVFTWPGPTSILVRGSNAEQRWASGLCAGNSTVTVTDANGCSAQLTVTIGSPGPCPPSLICDGRITIQGFTQGTSFCSPPAAIVSPCPGQPYGYWIRMVNTSGGGEQFTYPFILEVDLDPLMSFSAIIASYGCSTTIISTSPILQIEITNPSGSACIVWIAVDINGVPTSIPPGVWNTTASFTTDCSDGSTLAEAATIHDGPAQCSCDPNDKEVFPAGCGDLGFITNQELTYHVRFQNVGTGPATDVVLRDTLDDDLKISTLQILSSSHPITNTQINQSDRELVITFQGINLPAEINDPAGSNGFVTFSIEPKSGLQDGTTIINTTGIIFNGNPPVITKEVINTIVKDPVVKVDAGADQIVQPGVPQEECADLTSVASGALPPYSFLWSTSDTTQSITVCPPATTSYSVIADASGCLSVADTVTVFAADTLCGNNNDKVLICHVPPGNPSNAHEICISPNAVIAHLAHGDYLGPCLDSSLTDSLNQQPLYSQVFLTAYPNPLSQKTTITFSLPEPGDVTLAIYYSNSLDIAKLLDGYAEANVIYSVQFDAGNLASGMYFYQLITQTGTYTKKLVIIK